MCSQSSINGGLTCVIFYESGSFHKVCLPAFEWRLNLFDWNIDMLYVWEISPGSELSFDWKNSSLIDNADARQGYFQNFENTLHVPKNNNFSLKILYYIDYQSLVKKHKKGAA